jgi:methylated-DNA-[protein]-cysteine S-methyltransferase
VVKFMADKYRVYIETPMGPFCFWGDDEAVTGASFPKTVEADSEDLPEHMIECRRQCVEYFDGRRTTFDIPLRAEGTEFQREVWAEMCSIPHGETRSYGQVAEAVDRPGGARAVGQACANNPIGLIQPCHRVIGSDGNLTGFGHQSKDLGLKRALIDHEAEAHMKPLEGFEE